MGAYGSLIPYRGALRRPMSRSAILVYQPHERPLTGGYHVAFTSSTQVSSRLQSDGREKMED